MNKALLSSASNEWETPQDFFDGLNREHHFTLDPCATPENAKCQKYFTIQDDGLSKSWQGETVFCNPPYGKEIGKWVKKAHEESKGDCKVVMLIPARTDTKYWHDYIFGHAEITFVKGRLKFSGCKDGAPFPSAVIVFERIQ